MDPFAFFDNRELDLEDLFSDKKPRDDDIAHLFRKLGHCMDKKSNVWWDQSTMEKYLKDNLIPRKLRWDVPINDGLLGNEDIDEWYSFFESKGREIMEFLIKRKQRKLKSLENQIKEIRDKISPFKDTPEYNKHMGELQKNMQKKDLENRNGKKKKYQRDLDDYQNKRVYRWQATLENNVANNSQIDNTGDQNVGARAPYPPNQQQQDGRPPNRGHPPHQYEDKQPYTPLQQPLRRAQMDYDTHQGLNGRRYDNSYQGPPTNQGNWGYGAPHHRGNGFKPYYGGNQYGRGHQSYHTPNRRGAQHSENRSYGPQYNRNQGYQQGTPMRGDRRPPYGGPPAPPPPPPQGYGRFPQYRDEPQRNGVYYSPKPQRTRYDRHTQDQYGVPVYNSYQPLADNSDRYSDESFLGKNRDGFTREGRNPGRGEEDPDEGYSRKRRRED